MKKLKLKAKQVTEGFILLDAMIGIIIVAIFLGSISSAFAVQVKTITVRKAAVHACLDKKESYIQSLEYAY